MHRIQCEHDASVKNEGACGIWKYLWAHTHRYTENGS